MWFYEALANFVWHVFAWHVGERLICRTIPSLYLFSVRVFASCNGLLQSLHSLRPSAKNPNSTTLLPSCHDITAEEASAASVFIQNFLQRREAEFLLFCSLTEMNFPFFCQPEIFPRCFRRHVYLRDQSIVTNTWSDAWHITAALPAQQRCAQTISANAKDTSEAFTYLNWSIIWTYYFVKVANSGKLFLTYNHSCKYKTMVAAILETSWSMRTSPSSFSVFKLNEAVKGNNK